MNASTSEKYSASSDLVDTYAIAPDLNVVHNLGDAFTPSFHRPQAPAIAPQAPSPTNNEQLRVQDLAKTRLLDTPACEHFDNLLELCKQLLGVSMASIGLLDSHRMWFKSSVGLGFDECQRKASFCNEIVAQGEPLMVPNAAKDPRFAQLPMVTGAPHVRFYAGVPLRSGRGFKLGTLAIYSSTPRTCSAQDLLALLSFATQAEALIEKHELGLAALTDALTGIHNRRYFDERASEAVSAAHRDAKPLSVIAFDVDDFKQVNDTYGHSVGDQALIAIANSVTKQIRRPDVISRVGGEEFHVLLPNTDTEGAVRIAQRLREAVHEASLKVRAQLPSGCIGDEGRHLTNSRLNDSSAKIPTSSAAFKLSCSFGIAQLERGEAHIDHALKRADAAMYKAKGCGKDRVICNVREQK